MERLLKWWREEKRKEERGKQIC